MIRSVNVKKTKSSKKIVLKITMSMTIWYPNTLVKASMCAHKKMTHQVQNPLTNLDHMSESSDILSVVSYSGTISLLVYSFHVLDLCPASGH